MDEIAPIRKRRFLLPLIIAAIAIIVVSATIGTVVALGVHSATRTTSPLLAKTTPKPNVTYDCVNGSTQKIQLGAAQRALADLNIPEKYPTLTIGSLEYLFVSDRTKWSDAQIYCTAWCGYLASIKRQEENDQVLGMQSLYF